MERQSTWKSSWVSLECPSKGVAWISSCGVFFWLLFWKPPLNILQGFSSKFPLEFLLWSLYADFTLLKSPLDSLLNSSTLIYWIICLPCQKQTFQRSLIVKERVSFKQMSCSECVFYAATKDLGRNQVEKIVHPVSPLVKNVFVYYLIWRLKENSNLNPI